MILSPVHHKANSLILTRYVMTDFPYEFLYDLFILVKLTPDHLSADTKLMFYPQVN